MTYLDEGLGIVFKINEPRQPTVYGKEFDGKMYLERDTLIVALIANGERSAAKLLQDYA